jgi:hypothetical protein
MVVTVTNTSLVYYYGKNIIELPQSIVHIIHALEDFFDKEPVPIESQSALIQIPPTLPPDNIHDNKVPKKVSASNTNNSFKSHYELSKVGSTCSSTLKGPSKKNIYRWVDDNGTINLSDKPRTIDRNSTVTIVGVIEPELVSINYRSNNSSQILKNKINASVLNAKQFFERAVPKSLVKPVSINFRIFTEINRYESYRKKVAPHLGPNNGFYTSFNNESVVMVHSKSQGVRTSVHEAMHSINRHWFGSMSRWLNEGIAEYAETDQKVLLKDASWFRHLNKKQLMPLTQLFQSGENEWRNQQNIMYASSLGFVAFLMDEERLLLSRLLLAENVNGCDTLKLLDVERISGSEISSLQQDFNLWMRKNAG